MVKAYQRVLLKRFKLPMALFGVDGIQENEYSRLMTLIYHIKG